MTEEREAILAPVCERFVRLARCPEDEKTFPVGPASAKQLGYLAGAIDALPPSATEQH